MGLQQYAPAFENEGYDDLAFIDEMDAGASRKCWLKCA